MIGILAVPGNPVGCGQRGDNQAQPNHRPPVLDKIVRVANAVALDVSERLHASTTFRRAPEGRRTYIEEYRQAPRSEVAFSRMTLRPAVAAHAGTNRLLGPELRSMCSVLGG